MDAYATDRQVNWTVQNGEYEFRFEKYGHNYLWRCTELLRSECLRAVSLDAANPNLNLSHVDAVFITGKIREVIQPEMGDWIEVEAAPIERSAEVKVDKGSVRWPELAIISSVLVFWAMVIMAARAWR